MSIRARAYIAYGIILGTGLGLPCEDQRGSALVLAGQCDLLDGGHSGELAADRPGWVERGVQVHVKSGWILPERRREIGRDVPRPLEFEQRPALGDRAEQVHDDWSVDAGGA